MARRRIRDTQGERLRRIYRQYLEAGGTQPVRLDALYDFARQNGLPIPPPSDPRRQFRRLMSRALREDYFVDAQGRTVRRYHATLFTETDENGNAVRRSEWDDIDTAPRPFMETAFQVRRRQIVGDCQQLKNDVDHFNDCHSGDRPIRTLFDFTDDVNEGTLPGEYNPDGTE